MQAHSGIGDLLDGTALCAPFIMSPVVQQSSANLKHEEVPAQADSHSLRCASEIISGIAVTSVHRKPQVEQCHISLFYSFEDHTFVRLSMAPLVQLSS
jgi:hypothetical protein